MEGKEVKMFVIHIYAANGDVILDLATINRNAARFVYLVCQENSLACSVVKEQEPKEVTFK